MKASLSVEFESFLALALGEGAPDSPQVAPQGELFGPEPRSPGAQGCDLGFDPGGAVRELRAISPRLLDLVVKTWMSEEGLVDELRLVIQETRSRGSCFLEDYSNRAVRSLSSARARVDREIDRFTGLARFSPRRDGLYAAIIESDHNILSALMPRFALRFGATPYAIVDMGRLLAAERRAGRTSLREGEEVLSLLPGGGADEARDLWRRYFGIIGNPGRASPLLRRRLMPERYWKYLSEMGGGAEPGP